VKKLLTVKVKKLLTVKVKKLLTVVWKKLLDIYINLYFRARRAWRILCILSEANAQNVTKKISG